MKNKDIFDNPIYRLPLSRDIHFKDFLSKYFDNLLENLNFFEEPIKSKLAGKMDLIKFQIDKINLAIEAYFKGFPGQAFDHLEECLNELKKQSALPIQELKQTTDQDEYYRIRTDLATGTKEQLFHIPFELREIVATQRYSIPGLPCLYVADSLYVCWEELGRPDLNRISVSRFDLNDSGFKFLFLNDSYILHRDRCFKTNEDGDSRFVNGLIHYLTLLPLLASCSVKVKNTSGVFKPEYIIPQLILQWIVINEDLDGVKYRSNQVSQLEGMQGSFSNLVIPAKSMSTAGYCSILKSKIKLTEPLAFKIHQISPVLVPQKLAVEQIAASMQRVSDLEVIKGIVWDYSTTEFGFLEEKLRGFKAENIL